LFTAGVQQDFDDVVNAIRLWRAVVVYGFLFARRRSDEFSLEGGERKPLPDSIMQLVTIPSCLTAKTLGKVESAKPMHL